MKNAINYYYNINAKNIHQNNKNYRFEFNESNYFFIQYEENINRIKEIYNMHLLILNSGLYCHQIILNINNSPLTTIDGKNYILLKMLIPNRKVTLNDILYFSQNYIVSNDIIDTENKKNKFNDNLNKFYINNWFNLWTTKVDYIEYQISQLGIKYPLISQSISYYIGLSENAIQYLKNNSNIWKKYSISHKRIYSHSTLFDLYNPINFIIDIYVRDICEYIKDSFFESKIDIISILKGLNLNSYDATIFFARLLYPTYYFDTIEKCIDNNESEDSLIKYISKVNEYQEMLKKVMIYLNEQYNIDIIEWIIKT